ncbi:LruC domain-containing protein [Aestuariibacter salexigens]|uniref:LruC domain-containing protein n=1 Tax=Aestuariibacter salexigens TaxID=226010 RepID=UPI0003F66A60|nr:LruC domain-containing protein [Aestuariibacter salexigens]
MKKTMTGVLLSGLTLAMPCWAALESTMLRDSIDQGYGMIDLFDVHQNSNSLTDLDGFTLQGFREQHGNMLVFVVDVNEASNGTENSESQGVAISTAELIFNFGDTQVRCTHYATNTASLLATTSQSTRQQYQTLIGATGSNLITPSTSSDLYGSDFSAILRMRLDDQNCSEPLPNLSGVTSAFLEVVLVDTDVNLGDPEAFYDYSNGPEDIAIISAQDIEPVETVQAGVELAPLVIAQSQVTETVDAWMYYPSDNNYYVVTYEDNYPNKGDYDFNDLVVGYRVGLGLIFNEQLQQNEVTSIVATGYMIARGAAFTHDWYLHIPANTVVSGTALKNLFKENSTEQVEGYPLEETITGEIDLKVLEDTKQMMAVQGSQFANTLDNQSLVYGKKFSFSINLDSPVLLSEFAAPPFDPYLHVKQTNYEIHLSGFDTRVTGSANAAADTHFKDENGFPYALIFPDDWYPPLEGVDIGQAYEQFLDYALSPSTDNESWYLSPQTSEIKPISKTFWSW